eukprot:366415-Chlamydomonas_euryale.AAC.8
MARQHVDNVPARGWGWERGPRTAVKGVGSEARVQKTKVWGAATYRVFGSQLQLCALGYACPPPCLIMQRLCR